MVMKLTRFFRVALAAAFVAAMAATAPAQQVPTVPVGPTTDDLFNGDVLQRVDLKLNSRDWQALKLNYQDNTYYPADLTWNGITVRNVGIRSRGNGSRSGQKPGLRVDMDRYTSKQQFLGLKSLVLDNVWQDPSFMKEKIAMDLFRRLGQPASREAFARLYVNNTFAGLYVVIESVDKDFLTRNFEQNEGYLYEYNWVIDWNFTWLGGDYENYAPLFSPKTNESKSAEKLYGPIEQMLKDVNEARDDKFEETFRRYMNPDDVLTHLAIENAIAEEDGILGAWGMNNFYWYRFEDVSVSRFIVWDKDYSFWSPEFPIFNRADRNTISRRLFAIRGFRDFYLTKLREIAGSMSEVMTDLPADVTLPEGQESMSWLEWQVEKNFRLIDATVRLDPYKPTDWDAYNGQVEGLRVFARARPQFIKCAVAKELTPRDADKICNP
jgi:spore coat protein CotH